MDLDFAEELLKLTLIGAPNHQFPAKRPVHSFGIAAYGHFRGSTHAQRYCAAEQFSAAPTPTIVRFSNSAGQDNPEAEPQIRGMAVKFFNGAGYYYRPDSAEPEGQPPIEEVDLICTGLPNFFAATPEPLVDLFKALKPKKVKPSSWLERKLADLRLNPLPKPAVAVSESADAAVLKWAKDNTQSHAAVAALGLNATQPPPASFCRMSYNAVHAFNIVGNDKAQRVARFSFEPALGVRDASKPDEDQTYNDLPKKYLTEELAKRLFFAGEENSDHSVRFTLRMTLADPWDDPKDPTVVWPSNRRQVIMGTLELKGLYQSQEVVPDEFQQPHDGEKLSFNPGRLPYEHMYPTDDELLKARIAVYELSQQRRGASCPLGSGVVSTEMAELLWPGLGIVG